MRNVLFALALALGAIVHFTLHLFPTASFPTPILGRVKTTYFPPAHPAIWIPRSGLPALPPLFFAAAEKEEDLLASSGASALACQDGGSPAARRF